MVRSCQNRYSVTVTRLRCRRKNLSLDRFPEISHGIKMDRVGSDPENGNPGNILSMESA
jgi:hypothetical protein